MRILNLGCGPSFTGTTPGLEIINADRRYYNDDIDNQNMESLTYPDNSFDLVVCINALDHTIDALSALKEIIRVSKGWVYIDCALDQLTYQGKKHYWDAKEDGRFVSNHPRTSGYDGATPIDDFDLKDYGFSIEYIDNGGERQYNHIIARKS